MIAVKPVHDGLEKYLKGHQLEKKFSKAVELLQRDLNHPSLNVELLEPKHLRVYSFRIVRKYRALFVFRGGEIEIVAVTNHYK